MPAATPQKSSPATFTTIGGEAGGRAPIVVEDKHKAEQEAAQNKETDTAAGQMGRPEPGVDVFAEKPVNDAKSSGNIEGVVKEDQDTRKVEKEVSSVAPEAQTTIDAAAAVAAEPKKEDAETSSASSSTSESSSAVAEEKKVPAEEKKEPEDVPAVPPKEPAGPLDEMDMEAQKVAEELYPEAAGA